MGLDNLSQLIKGLESQESWQVQRQFSLVVQHWPKVVGAAVARNSRPIGIQRGCLHVATSTAAWAQTLAYERMTILKKLNRYQRQAIRRIRFSTAQWVQPAPPPVSAQKLTEHPCFSPVTTGINLADKQNPPSNPAEAFERWASMVQDRQRSHDVCPRCQCRCPHGELERWQVCALCAVKDWA